MSQIKGMHFGFVPQDGQDKEANLLDEWLKQSRTVPGTQTLHSVVPVTTSTVKVKPFSSNEYSRNENVALAGCVPSLPVSPMGGYVTVTCVGLCWLGCYHSNVPPTKYSFSYPAHDDVDPSGVLTHVSPIRTLVEGTS